MTPRDDPSAHIGPSRPQESAGLPRTSRLPALAASVALACATLTACSSDRPDDLVASGRAYLEKSNPTAAAIQLKNALQQNPDLPEARFLLGRALLESRDPVSAEVELRKALHLKHPPEAVLPLLAKAMLAKGDARQVIAQFATTALAAPVALADLKTSVATAYAAYGNVASAQSAVAAALRADPGHVPALVLEARLQAARGDVDQAFRTLERVLAKAPDDGDALVLKGDLLRFRGDGDAALQAYRKALATGQDRFGPRTAIVSMLLARNELDAAQRELDLLRKERPGQAQVAYLEAELALRKGDVKAAKELTQELLKAAPDHPRVLQLAAAAELRDNSLLRAEQLLRKALNIAPDLPGARYMLARAYVGAGEPAKALEMLGPLLEGSPAADHLRLAASAHLQTGDTSRAQELFAKVLELDPGDIRTRTALAVANLGTGREDVSFGELESLAASDAGITADSALVSAYISRREFDKALPAIDALEQKQPGKPFAANLRGRVFLMQGDVPRARQHLEKSLSLDPAFLPALEGLAAIDVMQARPHDARARFEKFLKKNPENHRAMLALARLRHTAGAQTEQVTSLVAQAIKLAPTDPAPRLFLVNYHLQRNDVKQAVTTAQDAVATLPDSPDALDALGRAHLAAGDVHQAVNAFGTVSTMRPRSPDPLLRLAEAHLAAGDGEAAMRSAKRAVERAPRNVAVQRKVIEIAMAAGRPKDALEGAHAIQREPEHAQVGFMLEGDIEVIGKNWAAAAAAYRNAQKAQESTTVAQKLHLALLYGGDQGAADSMASEWMAKHPGDANFLSFLGGLALSRKNLPDAEAKFMEVVKLQPQDPAALNNLARVMWQLGRPGAIEHAEKANKLAPDRPLLMDTLATILAGQNKLDRAIEVQQKAVALEPAGHVLRLNLAKLYLKNGQKAKARKELDSLIQLGDAFAHRNEAQQLRSAL